MAESPEQAADRWSNEVAAHATRLVDEQMAAEPINLDVHARREVLELGISAGHTATLQLLVREGLLPTSRGTH